MKLYKPFKTNPCYSRAAKEVQMLFKIGDYVQYQGDKTKTYYGEKGRLVELAYSSANMTTWKVQFDAVFFGSQVIDEKDLKFIHRKPKKYESCQCGAHAQKGFENFHSDWCPLYRGQR